MHTHSPEPLVGLQDLVKKHLEQYFSVQKGVLMAGDLYETVMNEIEKPLFIQTLQAVGGNQTRAAQVLGINRNTLRKRLAELGITEGAKNRA